MIDLTREEALNILKCLSRIDGFLFSGRSEGSIAIAEELEYPSNLLSDKLK